MKHNIKIYVVATLLVFFALCLFFYISQIKVQQRDEKLASEYSIIEQDLIQNRILFFSIFRLDPLERSFFETKNELYERFLATTGGLSGNTKMHVRAREVVVVQREKVEKVRTFSDIVQPIYRYNPLTQFNDYHEMSEDMLVEKVAEVEEGIQKIKRQMMDEGYGNYQDLDAMMGVVENLHHDLAEGNFDGFEDNLKRLANEIDKVKIIFFEYEKSLLSSNEMVQAMVDESNLIIELGKVILSLSANQ